MKQERINVAEMLKHCPKGMELDCISYNGVVTLGEVTNNIYYPISINVSCNNENICVVLTEYGQTAPTMFNKCVIFPKGKTTWEGFIPPCKFKDGDILFVDCSDSANEIYSYIFILDKPEHYGKWYSYCFLDNSGIFDSTETYLTDDRYSPRFATEEEKAKLFQAIMDNGYKWNEETKTLEKLIGPKSAWSEEDEIALGDALWCCKQAASIAKDEYDMGNTWYAENWLKSLKDRCTWKPSNEQIIALRWVLNNVPYNKHKEEISGLLDQIKEL